MLILIRKIIKLTDLLLIASSFLNMSVLQLSYYCFVRHIDVDYKEEIDKELLINSLYIMHMNLINDSFGEEEEILEIGRRILKIIIEKDFLEFVLMNCIENNLLMKGNYRVVVDMNFGFMKSRSCYETDIATKVKYSFKEKSGVWVGFGHMYEHQIDKIRGEILSLSCLNGEKRMPHLFSNMFVVSEKDIRDGSASKSKILWVK